jgi:hypothetical protein
MGLFAPIGVPLQIAVIVFHGRLVFQMDDSPGQWRFVKAARHSRHEGLEVVPQLPYPAPQRSVEPFWSWNSLLLKTEYIGGAEDD